MGLDNAASASVACKEPPSPALASKVAAGEPAPSLQTPYSDRNMRITTSHSPLYLSDTPALTVSSLPPSSPKCLQDLSHQAKQLGPADASCDTDVGTDIESLDNDASIHLRRVKADPDTLMAAEVLMRLCGRNNVNKPTGAAAFKILRPAFSTLTNVPLCEISSQRSNPLLLHHTPDVPSLVTAQKLYTSISITTTPVNSLPLAPPFANPSPKTLPVGSTSDQPLDMSPASPNIGTTAQSVIEETAVVALVPLPPTGTPQSTPQATKATTEEVKEPKVILKSKSRKRKRNPSPAAGSQPTSETKRNTLKIPTTVKCRTISPSAKKSTNKVKDTTTKSSRSAKRDPSFSPKSNAASEGLIGHLITVLSLDGRSSLPFSKIVGQVLESQPHLLDERPATEWSELVKKTLNYSRNTMFGRAERKGLKVCS